MSGPPPGNPLASQFQGLPQSISAVLASNGTMNDAWYKFLQSLWLQTASGTPNSVTLQGVYTMVQAAQQAASAAQSAANAAQTTANAAQASATAAQGTADGANTSIAAETARAEAAEANLQSQINTINARLAAAGIP